ncbi:MAG: hypothetical protein ACJAZ9_000528 [Neolewinella sp.]
MQPNVLGDRAHFVLLSSIGSTEEQRGKPVAERSRAEPSGAEAHLVLRINSFCLSKYSDNINRTILLGIF